MTHARVSVSECMEQSIHGQSLNVSSTRSQEVTMLATLGKNLKNFVSICYYGFIFLITGNSNGLETIMRCSKIVFTTSRKKREECLSQSSRISNTNKSLLTTSSSIEANPRDDKKCEIHSIEIKTLDIPN